MRVLQTLLAVLVAAVILCAAIVLPLVATGEGDGGGTARMGAANGQGGSTKDTGDLSAVEQYDVTSLRHTQDPVDYPQAPPVGGEHDPTWLECGVYDEPVREENAVHALEHGTVWITHDPDLSQADVDKLAGLLPDEGILSPHEGQEAPVVVTVWGTQLALEGADDSRLPLFLQEYGHGETAPEPMASCHGGVERFESEESGTAA